MARKRKKSIQADVSAKINIPNLKNIYILVQAYNVRPKTPEWTDRSRNGRGFFCVQQPRLEVVDLEGTGSRKYRRN